MAGRSDDDARSPLPSPAQYGAGLGFRDDPVRRTMRRRFVRIGPEESLYEAARIMQFSRIRHLPVLAGDLLVGILSAGDVLRAESPPHQVFSAAERQSALRAVSVEQAMTRSPETVRPDTSLGEAASRLYVLRIGCLPVVEPGPRGVRMVGLVTESDLLRAAYDPHFTWD